MSNLIFAGKTIDIASIYDWYFEAFILNGSGNAKIRIYHSGGCEGHTFGLASHIFSNSSKQEATWNEINRILNTINCKTVKLNFLRHAANQIATDGQYEKYGVVFTKEHVSYSSIFRSVTANTQNASITTNHIDAARANYTEVYLTDSLSKKRIRISKSLSTISINQLQLLTDYVGTFRDNQSPFEDFIS